MTYSYVLKVSREPDLEEGFFEGWEETFGDRFDEWKLTTTGANFYLFTIASLKVSFVSDIEADINLLGAAIVLVALYTCLFLGSFSPIHCRCIVALTGLLTIGLAYSAGFGILYAFGMKTTGVHQLMPFLLIGVGVDDMFVMCNAIDQTDLKKTA
jgi:Niemann-Pick C1 protein